MTDPAWPLIPGDPFPYGVLVFCVFLPGTAEKEKADYVRLFTDYLSAYEKRLGGRGLKVVREGFNQDTGRYEWIVDPIEKDYWARQRMALVAIRLRQIENSMVLGKMEQTNG